MNVTVSRNTPDTLSAPIVTNAGGGSALVSGKVLSRTVSHNEPVDIIAKSWASNPYLWSSEGMSQASVVSLDVTRASDGSTLPISNLTEPIIVQVPAPAATSTDDFKCGFWNNDTGTWEAAGTVVVAFDFDEASNTLIAACGTVHLSDFSATIALNFIHVELPNPLTDIGLLSGAFSSHSLFTSGMTLGLLVATLLGWIAAVVVDAKTAEKLRALRRIHIMMYGTVTTGLGVGLLHHGGLAAGKERLQKLHDKMKSAEKRGTTALVLTYLLHAWWYELRCQHLWLSLAFAPLERRLVISRPQRIIVVSVSLLSNFSVAAVFYHTSQYTVTQGLVAGMLSTFSMLPFEFLLPRLFRYVNTYHPLSTRVREMIHDRYKRTNPKAYLWRKGSVEVQPADVMASPKEFIGTSGNASRVTPEAASLPMHGDSQQDAGAGELFTKHNPAQPHVQKRSMLVQQKKLSSATPNGSGEVFHHLAKPTAHPHSTGKRPPVGPLSKKSVRNVPTIPSSRVPAPASPDPAAAAAAKPRRLPPLQNRRAYEAKDMVVESYHSIHDALKKQGGGQASTRRMQDFDGFDSVSPVHRAQGGVSGVATTAAECAAG